MLIKLMRWATEMPKMLSVLPVFDGIFPFAKVRFGDGKETRVRVRKLGVISLPDKPSAMVFANIWARHVYPAPGPEDVVLDLGANIGMFSLYAMKSGARFIHSVEPCPDSVNRLRDHLSSLNFGPRSNVIPAAIGESAGSAFISTTTNITNTVSSEKQAGTVAVPILDASVLFDSLKPSPTFLKLDIESNEIPVLRRLLATPAFSSVGTVTVEVKGGCDLVVKMLEEAGFQVGVITYPETIVTGFRNSVPRRA